MTDKELLEAAAEAIGINHLSTHADGRLHAHWDDCCTVCTPWNPLTDDGDAFRLMVRLGMDVYVDKHPDGCECVEAASIYPNWKIEDRAIEDIGADHCAATRRAITRAAAALSELGAEHFGAEGK